MIFTLPHIIENSAVKFPEKIAFKFLKTSLTYAELELKMNQLAMRLIENGLRKGDRVGIYMHRCLETAVAVYGIMKAGGVYVPLDPFVPSSRTLFVINDCNIKQLVTTSVQSKKITELLRGNHTLQNIIGHTLVDDNINTLGWDIVYTTSLEQYKPINVLEHDLAYIIYTSGSTGTPKGIMHTHYSGLSYAKLAADEYQLSHEDIIGNHAPLHFDVSTFGYFSGPLASATTIIISDAHIKLPVSLADVFVKEKISVWYSVPLALIQLLINGLIDHKDFSALRWVLFAGEIFITKHLKALMQKWPHARFSNIYGPTEVNQCTYYHLDTPPVSDDPIPIGHIWKNSEYKIVDENLNEVTNDDVGELVVRTATMMKGYWNNEELTEKSLYKEIVAPGITNVFYKTGDMVKKNNKGELLFLGRNDRQVKIRGYRIELDEIETVLLKHDQIKEVAVIVLETTDNEKGIVAVVLPVRSDLLKTKEVLNFCKSFLPVYALPEKIISMSDLPRTGSGKVNRNEIKNILIQS